MKKFNKLQFNRFREWESQKQRKREFPWKSKSHNQAILSSISDSSEQDTLQFYK